MIKAILFDFDGVLTIDKTGSQSILNYIAKETNLSPEALKTAYHTFNRGLLHGNFTHKDIWKDFCNMIGCDIDYSILIDSFKHTPIDHDMISIVKELGASYQIGMITDNKCDRIEEIISHYRFEELFDVISVSAAYKSGKEERLIFEKTVEALTVSPKQCIFIDNSPKNLIVPRQMGMQTILFDDENRNAKAFQKMLHDMIANVAV